MDITLYGRYREQQIPSVIYDITLGICETNIRDILIEKSAYDITLTSGEVSYIFDNSDICVDNIDISDYYWKLKIKEN